MLTGLVEKGVDKCAPYWPRTAHETLQFGGWTVTLDSVTSHGDFRESRLSCVSGDVRHSVTHWWYDTWPDHGVPEKDGDMSVPHSAAATM